MIDGWTLMECGYNVGALFEKVKPVGYDDCGQELYPVHEIDCPDCRGSGVGEANPLRDSYVPLCPHCAGRGQVLEVDR